MISSKLFFGPCFVPFLYFFCQCSEVTTKTMAEREGLKLQNYKLYEYNDRQLVTKETTYSPSGKAAQYRTFKYDSVSRLVEDLTYTSYMSPLYKRRIIWNADSTIAKDIRYNDLDITGYTMYAYVNGKSIRELYYNAQDKLEQVSEFTRDKDGKMILSTFKKNNEVTGTMVWSVTGKKELCTTYAANSKKKNTSEFSYDNDHHLIERINKDSLDEVEQKIEWVYNQNKLQYSTVFYRGEIYSKEIYYYNGEAKLKRSDYFIKPHL